MKHPFLILCFLTAVLCAPGAGVAVATEPPPTSQDERRAEALQNIQDALDEDPEEAARLLGSTPVGSLDTDALEEIGNKAFQFVEQKRMEREQEEREARRRLRELQDIQNSRF